MLKYAVIVAGGAGLRMGAVQPKQFLLLKGKPILFYTLNQFVNAFTDIEIILVLPKEYLAEGKMLATAFTAVSKITIIEGGATRFQSVKNGLKQIKEHGLVCVHDGVRCLTSTSLIQSCFEQALKMGSAIPAVAATDSIRIVQGDKNCVANRNHVRIIQTPQTFQTELLLTAFEADFQESFTDEATVLEASGHSVHLIDGEYENIKITRPIDLLIAEKILEKNIDTSS